MPDMPWEDLQHPAHQDNWGLPLASQRGQVAWWDQGKGIGMIRRVEDEKEYFVCMDNILTDPFEEEPVASIDQQFAHLDMTKPFNVFAKELATAERRQDDERLAQFEAHDIDITKVGQHLYDEQLVWFDEDATELGPIAVNVQWELGAIEVPDTLEDSTAPKLGEPAAAAASLEEPVAEPVVPTSATASEESTLDDNSK